MNYNTISLSKAQQNYDNTEPKEYPDLEWFEGIDTSLLVFNMGGIDRLEKSLYETYSDFPKDGDFIDFLTNDFIDQCDKIDSDGFFNFADSNYINKKEFEYLMDVLNDLEYSHVGKC